MKLVVGKVARNVFRGEGGNTECNSVLPGKHPVDKEPSPFAARLHTGTGIISAVFTGAEKFRLTSGGEPANLGLVTMKIALLLVCSVILVRLLPMFGSDESLAMIGNFSPMVALMLCGGAYFARRASFLPLVGFLVSDLILNAFWHFKMHGSAEGVVTSVLATHTLLALTVYTILCFAGTSLRLSVRRSRMAKLFAGTLLGVIVFYVVSNTGSFFAAPAYEKSLAGWIQCLTVGQSGFPPTWTFLVKSLGANLIFTGLFVILFEWKGKTSAEAESVAVGTV
jgi:hypothetical protein